MKNPQKKLLALSKELDRWMREEAWPLWWKASRLDNGAFYEALDFEGRPVPSETARVRVQARQVFSTALAGKMGLRNKSLPEKLAHSIERFESTCLGPEGLPGMLVDIEKGVLTDPQPNLYVTAFWLLALAQSREVLGAQAIDPKIGSFLDRIDRWLALPGGGYREKLPSDATRLQNPHMHFYESLLALYTITNDSAVEARAAGLLGFVQDTFFDQRSDMVHEEVNPTLEMAAGQYEPGHSMEWVWLLGWRSRLFEAPLDPFALRLYSHCCSADIPVGRTPMKLTVDNRPVDATCRLWSQTESLKAHLTIAGQGPPELAPAALHRAVACAEDILGRWLATGLRGGFYDHFDQNGELVARDIPASMWYHLFVMVRELNRAANQLRKK